MSDVEKLLSEASAHNFYFLYEDAIQLLDKAIEIDPCEKDLYKERAFSYFELNQIELALKDYQSALKSRKEINLDSWLLGIKPSILGKTSPYLDFASGLLQGAMLGGREGTIEFVSSVRGGLTFLWSFACSPIDVSKDLIAALYEIGGFLASGRVDVLLREALPELYECAECWNSWSDYTKGQKLGFIIGKYSILAFYYVSVPKGGIYFYNKLRRANIMAIMERYSITRSSQILSESTKYAKRNTEILKKAASGSIIAHNPNVLPHVFTKKHRWDKFINLTGDHQQDFKMLVKFLEDEKILHCPRELDCAHMSVTTYKYSKQIGKEKIVAVFEINKEGVPFLRNAWVDVRIPYMD